MENRKGKKPQNKKTNSMLKGAGRDLLKVISKLIDKLKQQALVFIRSYFLMGLVALIPLIVCFWLISTVFSWISGLSMPYTLPIVQLFFQGRWVYPIVQLISFVVSIGIISFVGYFTTKLVGQKFLAWIEASISKLPVLSSVYNASKKFLGFLTSKEKTSAFKQAVLVPYPRPGVYSIAFLTGERFIRGEKFYSVFMPTMPNVTTGFMLLYKESDMIMDLNLSVDEAFQFALSVGVVISNPELTKMQSGVPKDADVSE
ncbi:MAG: DUF502 domain-containing protein [Elusimicrobia bacterium]|nr:DUF502 domain-containing protein [Elusimicrobiota bacterium]